MASPRLTKDMVHSAAAELDREGKKPTAANVRDRIGSGSYTTIIKFLADYEGPEAVDMPPEIPEAPAGALAAIWDLAYTQAWRIFKEQLDKVQQTADRHLDAVAELETVTNELAAKLDSTGRDLEAALRDLEAEKRRFELSTAALRDKLVKAETERDAATAEAARLFKTLQRNLDLTEKPAPEKPTPKAPKPKSGPKSAPTPEPKAVTPPAA